MEVVLIKIAQVVAAFSLLIVLHEGGHFLFAKLFKIRVEKFYLFFDFPIMTPRPQFAFFTYRQGKFSFLKYTKITIPKKSDDTDANNASNEPDYKASAFSVLSWNKGNLRKLPKKKVSSRLTQRNMESDGYLWEDMSTSRV